jgi:DNA adenine methylase
MARPFVKYVGGKTQNLSSLKATIPQRIDAYYEPMVGGGALFFHLVTQGRLDACHRVVLSDINRPLMKTYLGIQNDVQSVIEELAELNRKYKEIDSESLFYGVRNAWNDGGVQSPARYIFLKQTSFNGLWRENKKGNINMPWGKGEKPKILDKENLLTCHKVLQGVDLHMGPWDDALFGINDYEHAVVYFDPPYLKCFDKYNADGFSKADHQKLLEACANLTAAGVHVVYSNESNKLSKSLLEAFWPKAISREIPTRRFINSDGTGRDPVDDLLAHSNGQRELFA